MEAQNLRTTEEHTTSKDKLQVCAMSQGRRTGSLCRLKGKPPNGERARLGRSEGKPPAPPPERRSKLRHPQASHQRKQATKNKTEATVGQARAGTKGATARQDRQERHNKKRAGPGRQQQAERKRTRRLEGAISSSNIADLVTKYFPISTNFVNLASRHTCVNFMLVEILCIFLSVSGMGFPC